MLREKQTREADARADAEAAAFLEAGFLAEIEAEKALSHQIDLGQHLNAMPHRRKAITAAAQQKGTALVAPINQLKKHVETTHKAASQSKRRMDSRRLERKNAHQALQYHLAHRHFFTKFLDKIGLKTDRTRKRLHHALMISRRPFRVRVINTICDKSPSFLLFNFIFTRIE